MKSVFFGIKLKSESLQARFKKISLEFLWILVGQGFAITGALVGIRLLTSVLGPKEYGELALCMTIVMLSNQIVTGPFSQGFVRFFSPARESGQIGSYLRSVRDWLLVCAVVLLVVFAFIAVGLFICGRVDLMGYIMASLLLAVLIGFNGTLDGIQNAARERIIVAWHQGISQWARYLLAFFLLVIFGAKSIVALLGYITGAGIVLVSQYIFMNKTIISTNFHDHQYDKNEVNEWFKKIGVYSWPFVLWGIFAWVYTSSDRWVLQIFTDTRQVGLYAVLYQIGYFPISLAAGLLIQLIVPIFFNKAGDGQDNKRLAHVHLLNIRLIFISVAFTVIAAVVALIFHRYIFELVTSPEYFSVSKFLPIMVLAGGLFATGQVASILFMTDMRSNRLIAPKIVSALVGVILNVTMAYRFGLPGVIYSNIIFSLLYLSWVLYLHKRKACLIEGDIAGNYI
jgi:O-antigen/teichoic acid export membrane protein